jgi:hypothetical protein
MVIAYLAMQWAIEKYAFTYTCERDLGAGLMRCCRNEYYNSKPGRLAAEEGEKETELNMRG